MTTPNLANLTDRAAIEDLRVEFTDAAMMNDHERLGSLFTTDGVLRIPHGGIEAVGPGQISALGERRSTLAECFIQTSHPGRLELDGDVAVGRTYIHEIFQLRDGSSHVNHAIYHDRYVRAADGWKFAERVYEVRYLDNTPLRGSAPEVEPADEEGWNLR